MTIKEYLSQAFVINKLLKVRQSQIEELKEQRFLIGTMLDSVKVQSSPRNDKTGDLSVKLLDLIEEYTHDLNRLLELKTEIKTHIEKLGNPTHRLIMEERYINLKRWEDIAVDNNYAFRHVKRLHEKALLAIRAILDIPVENVHHL